MTVGTTHESEKLAKVGTNGIVAKGRDKEKNVIMRKNKIPDTRNGQRTACDALKNMFSVLALEPLMNKVSARRLTSEGRKSICV